MGAKDGSDFRGLVLQSTDIVELIGRTVALKKRGKNYVGLCPFHNEKSPSFNVDPAKQYYHCFGCKKSGNAIDFVIERDRVEFIDALKSLGAAAGLEMPKFGVSKEKTGEKQLLLDANSAAASMFQRALAEPAGKTAREYLVSRGFNDDSIKRFQIGLAVPGWDNVLKGLGRKFNPPQLLQAGLIKARDPEKGPGHYDVFRNRLMFPIRDETGRVIAFGGRILDPNDIPKYLNSPDSPLFSKSRTVYGLDMARQKIVESRTVVIVEGYTDVVMAHQYGATNVVATLGTAMTEQHVGILRRFADRIVLLFDADTAGDTAVDRSVELFLTQPVEIGIATLPDGLDPDEFLLQQGLEAFEKLIATAPDALTYKWKQLVQHFDAGAGNLTGQQKAIDQYLQLLASARGTGPVDALRWGSALARVSRLTDIPVDQLQKRFRAPPRSTPARPPYGQARSNERNEPNRPYGGNGVSRYPNRDSGNQDPVAAEADRRNEANTAAPESANSDPAGGTPAGSRRITSAQEKAERWILGILLAEPSLWRQVQKFVGPADFSGPRAVLAETYWNHQRDEGEPVFNEFLGSLAEPAIRELAVRVLEDVASFEDPKAVLTQMVEHILETRKEQEQRKLFAALRRNTEELPEQDEVDLLKKMQEKARQPDLRRH